MTDDTNQVGNLEPLGQRVRRLRQERKMSQDRLALGAQMDQSGLSKFERGVERKMGEGVLRRVAGYLQIPFEELIAGTDYKRK